MLRLGVMIVSIQSECNSPHNRIPLNTPNKLHSTWPRDLTNIHHVGQSNLTKRLRMNRPNNTCRCMRRGRCGGHANTPLIMQS